MGVRAVLNQVNVVVKDMAAMAAFYERLGMSLSAGPPEWAHHRNGEAAGCAHFDLDSSQFAAVWNRGWPEGRTGIVLSFQVPTRADVDTLYDELIAAGYSGQQPPFDAFWGAPLRHRHRPRRQRRRPDEPVRPDLGLDTPIAAWVIAAVKTGVS